MLGQIQQSVKITFDIHMLSMYLTKYVRRETKILDCFLAKGRL